MNQDSFSPLEHVLAEQRGGLGVITLNRPDSLNALSLEMIRQIAVTLKQWEGDDTITAVLFLGAGGKAFCAGGDVKSFYNSGMDYRRGKIDARVASVYFAEEYLLNKQIFEYPKKTIAIMDGIVMGGGYGIAGHCRHRIVTDHTLFAMPEVGIGFYPDVGSVYHLLKSPSYFGRLLALTGMRIKAGDVLAAGLADVYLERDSLDAFIDVLRKGDYDAVVKEHSMEEPAAHVFDQCYDQLGVIFSDMDALGICKRLREVDSHWAKDALHQILSVSPTSVCVTARYLDEMQGKPFDEVIARDYEITQYFIRYIDLYEGIRATLIDRDGHAAWDPATLEDVDDTIIERYFGGDSVPLSDIQIFS
ncbi:MAG: enoyl-CoA hydratase/isomerase family protein [Bdellovibrionales bacterium]